MKLTVGDIRFSESGYALATVKVETGTFPFLLFSACKMVVPVVDGKEINDYREDLKNKARETITKMYKEIVCGGDLDDEIIIPARGDITGEYGIKVANKNGKLSIVELVGGASDLLGLLRNEIKPSELSRESLAAVDSVSAGDAIKPFVIKDGKIIINASQITLTHHQMSKDSLERFIAELVGTDGLNQESDDSLVVRDTDGSVRVHTGFGQQTGLKVTISDKDDVLWMRDNSNQEGIMSLGYLKDGTQQRIIAALEDALFQAKGQVSCLPDDSIKVDFPVMRKPRYEPKGDSFFNSDKYERIGGNVQIELPSGELATLYYEEDLDLKSTFEGYLNRAKEHARKSIKAH